MLPGLAPAVMGGKTRLINYVNVATNTGSSTTYTFTGRALGPKDAAGKRDTIIAVGLEHVSSSRTVTAVNVGGLAATIEIASPSALACVALATVDTSTLGDTGITITVTGSAGSECGAIGIYVAYDLDSLTPDDSNAQQHSAGLLTFNPDVVTPGCVIGVVISKTASTTTWSGLTEDTDVELDSGAWFSCAHGGVPGTPAAISAQNAATSPYAYRGCIAAWS